MQLQVGEHLGFTGCSVETAQEEHLNALPLQAIDITPNQDGGVLKQVIRVGISNEQPLVGDRVLVHYEAMLASGQRVDSSRFRSDTGFEFLLGKGMVVKAWDIGVATMCAGEKARFFCQSSYLDSNQPGANSEELPQSVNIYSTYYDIELLSWQGEDVTKRKDGGVLKRILRKGSGRDTPNDGATCEVHIRGSLAGRVFEDRRVKFIMGEASEAEVVSGVELAVKKCKKGELVRLNVKPKYGYQSRGHTSYNIPPDADLSYEVEIIDFVRVKDFWDMDIGELLSSAQQFKDRGKHFFEMGKYELSLSRYQKIVRFLASETNVTGENRDAVRSFLLTGHLNIALCCIKLNDEVHARDASNSALELDAHNIKGLYRRGQANLGMHCLEEAEQDFLAVLKLEPGNKAAQQQLKLTKQKQAEVVHRQRSTFAGMFDKFAINDRMKESVYGHGRSDVFSDIRHWSNDLANGMMTLEQEMAAFGEKMPEPRYRNNDKENENPVDSDEDY